MSNKNYEGWNSEGHLEGFDFWNHKPDFYFNFLYGCFSEQQFLISTLSHLKSPSLLDVGCATGTTYRFAKNKVGVDNFEYTGIDLSEAALKKARTIYPKGNFLLSNQEKLIDQLGKKFDVVFSRDTIMHQTDPKSFINDLMSVASKTLIVRLRTRDKGETDYNVETSCQMHYEKYWMPYIVMNFDELINIFSTFPGVSKITANRSYETLGGLNHRYLPKELYFSNTGGAETSIQIEIDENFSGKPTISLEGKIQGREYIKKNRLKNYAYAAASRVLKKLNIS
jgi:2-polyprenyl-3-methyl-5-hydroxy-6-metoxy-1,4-benzoquinol methylase